MHAARLDEQGLHTRPALPPVLYLAMC